MLKKVSSIVASIVFVSALSVAPSGPESSRAYFAGPIITVPVSSRAQPLVVRVALAKRAESRTTRTIAGWIEPSASVRVHPRVSGAIIAQEVVEGQEVKKGDVLFRLDDQETRAKLLRSEALLARDRARHDRAVADLVRFEELVRRSAASPAQRDEIAADVAIFAAEVAASEAMVITDRIALDHATVRSPVAGRAGAIAVDLGSFVGASETKAAGLLTITQTKPARVSFQLPETDLPLLLTSLATTTDPALVHVYEPSDGKLLGSGSVTFIDPAVDSKSGTIRVVGLIPNHDNVVWPGQYVRVSVDFNVQEETVTVPLDTLVSSSEGMSVFVLDPGNKAEQRKVVLSETRDGLAFVASGISPGESVVRGDYPQIAAGNVVTIAAEAKVADASRQSGNVPMHRP